MTLKTGFLALLSWLPAMYAHAEAGKGLSRISQGEWLWILFFFGFGLPAALGLIVYLVIKLINKESKVSLTLIIAISVFFWWLG
ncbi:MAG: hypothetical protein EOO37_04300 [Cytophagaceae bacterium]|nr:MAG: hypothetical protein EOO37_04300 [Cytophagaceae bacterium]